MGRSPTTLPLLTLVYGSGQPHASAALPPGKESPIGTGEDAESIWRLLRDKNLFSLLEIKMQTINPLYILTSDLISFRITQYIVHHISNVNCRHL
jgi:hypothetical protein